MSKPLNWDSRATKGVRVFWSHDDQSWVAVDENRPGCCAVDTNKTRLRKEIKDAQAAWDEARDNLEAADKR
jgi:hypothetical protein